MTVVVEAGGRASGRALLEWPCHPAVFPRAGAGAAELATLLETQSVAAADDVDLLEQVVGWQQLVGVAVVAQARAVRELVARGHDAMGGLADEIASVLASTRTAAQVLVSRAAGLGELPVVESALRDGAMDVRKVDVVLDELAALAAGTDVCPDRASVDAAAAAVADVAASRASELTPTQLRRLVRREVIAADPAASHERARRALEQRRVEVGWAPDGMAWVSALLSAPDAMLVRAVLDAGTEPDAHDERSRDQRRADLFVSVFRTSAGQCEGPDGTTPSGQRRGRAHIQVTVAASTLLGLDETPAELAGYGPLPAGVARQVAADATWRRLLTDPVDGTLVERSTRAYRPGRVLGAHVMARDGACMFPGCVRPATTCEVDHVEPWRARRDLGAAAATGPPQTRPDNLQPLCKAHHDLKTRGLWHARREQHGAGVEWTSQLGLRYLVQPKPVLPEPETFRRRGPVADVSARTSTTESPGGPGPGGPPAAAAG